MVVVEPAQGVGPGRGDDGPVPGPAHPQLDERREVGLVLDDQDRVSHRRHLGARPAAPSERRPGRGSRSGRSNATRVPAGHRADPRAAAVPPCASTSRREMNSPRPVPGIRDSRTFQARWKGSVTSGRSAAGMPTPSSSMATWSHVAVDRAPRWSRARSGGPYLKALPTRFSRIWPTRAPSTSIGGQVVGQVDDQPVGAGRDAARSPRSRVDEGREQDRRPLEDERVRLQVGHVEDLADERGQALGHLVDALDVGALLAPARGRGGGASRRSRG